RAYHDLHSFPTRRSSDLGLHELDLLLQPPVASDDLVASGLLVDAALTSRRPLEVLDRVREVDAVTDELGLFEGVVENVAGRPDRSEEHTSELQSRSDLVC